MKLSFWMSVDCAPQHTLESATAAASPSDRHSIDNGGSTSGCQREVRQLVQGRSACLICAAVILDGASVVHAVNSAVVIAVYQVAKLPVLYLCWSGCVQTQRRQRADAAQAVLVALIPRRW